MAIVNDNNSNIDYAEQERLRQEEIKKRVNSINDTFYKNLSGIKDGSYMYGGFDYDPSTGELTEKGKQQQKGYYMAKAITGQEVGQSGLDMQKIKKMREEAIGSRTADADLAANASSDRMSKLQQKAGMSGTDVAGLISDSARRGKLEAASINEKYRQSALDKFAQNVMTMAGINLSTIQGYENMGNASQPLPVADYSSGGLFG